MFFSKKKDLIGIDVGSTAVKLVQLRQVKGGFEIESIGVAPLPAEAIVDNSLMDSTAVVECIRGLVNNIVVRKVKEAASSVSGNSVIIRKIMLPAATPEEVDAEIQWESEQYIPFDINDVNIDYQILEPDENDPSKMNVLLVASKKDIINDYHSVFSESGLKLVVVDVDAFAVQNAFELNYELDPEEVYALVNIGANMMNLNVVKAGVSLFIRDVQMGGTLYTEEIQKKLGVNGDEAERMKVSASASSSPDTIDAITRINETIAQEIRRSLDFYNSNALEGRISKVFLSGGGCLTMNLPEAVTNRLSLPVEVLNPFSKLKWNEKLFDSDFLSSIAPIMSVAVGLASRRLGDK
jgi:type IV pilus assembly protein PilM